MRSTAGRVALGIAVVAIAIVLLIVLRDDGDDEPVPDPGANGAPAETRPGYGERPSRRQAPPVARVEVEGGEPVGGVQRLEFSAGERARFVVESDIADEVHVHGYDIVEDVPAGGEARFAFPADLQGVYEVEMHGSGAQIAELRITP